MLLSDFSNEKPYQKGKQGQGTLYVRGIFYILMQLDLYEALLLISSLFLFLYALHA